MVVFCWGRGGIFFCTISLIPEMESCYEFLYVPGVRSVCVCVCVCV
jgi:hypothetical protein